MKTKRILLIIFVLSLTTASLTQNSEISAQEHFNWWILHFFYFAVCAFLTWIVSQVESITFSTKWLMIGMVAYGMLTVGIHEVFKHVGFTALPILNWIPIPSLGSIIIIAMAIPAIAAALCAGILALMIGFSRID